MSKELSHKIRRLCNHPWKRELLIADKSKWHQLWASLDLINDTQEAIDYYKIIPDENFKQGGYLHVFGLLQAIFVQQDAAINLNKALFGKSIDFKKDYPELHMIREHRNNSIGHPTGRGTNDSGSYHIIDGTSINKSSFDLVSHYPNQNQNFLLKNIDTEKCINIQENLINEILIKVMDKLKLDFEQHKKKFKGNTLFEVVGNNLDYSLSKLYEFESPFLKMNFDIISDTYAKVREGIENRYSNLQALQGVQFTCERIEYILNRLRNDLVTNKIEDELELEVFIDALIKHIQELVEMVKEIDTEFEK